MSKKVTIGGNRLGSGGKMTETLHGYGTTPHNLSREFKSSMTTGTLVPFVVELMLNGDHCTIDLDSIVRTHPTVGAMFGSFKMQMDVFKCPIRYYIAELHNNKKGVGLQMQNVFMPIMSIEGRNPDLTMPNLNQQQIDPASLLHYLGIVGLGKGAQTPENQPTVTRKFNAVPLLSVWDIYANYYANLQEGIGAVINNTNVTGAFTNAAHHFDGSVIRNASIILTGGQIINQPIYQYLAIGGSSIGPGTLEVLYKIDAEQPAWISVDDLPSASGGDLMVDYSASGDRCNIRQRTTTPAHSNYLSNDSTQTGWQYALSPVVRVTSAAIAIDRNIKIDTFDIKNIDLMREAILKNPAGTQFDITTQNYLPYSATTAVVTATDGKKLDSSSKAVMAGLPIKTYLSDRFNNWLSEEFIDGANGVSEISAIDVSDGTLTMDALNLQQKIYNVLNRIVLSGGSYRDWQEAVYAHRGTGELEIPEYVGGASCDIMFNEIISTNANESTASQQPLGSLGGRGKQDNIRKNKIHITATEPCFIIGLASITPRLDYSQGNKWWNRLMNMDELHKPELDGIGFQDLLIEEAAAWTTEVAVDGTPTYKSAGKQLAWTEYTTSQNDVHGNFANNGSEEFMVLGRGYEPDENGEIANLTTYIDPRQYNSAFATEELSSQHFWVQIYIDMFMKRVMSGSQIPQL